MRLKNHQKLLTILNILILFWVPAGETEQLPTDVNWTVLSYLIAHVLCLSPCIHPRLIRNFYSFCKCSMIPSVWARVHALFQILNIELCDCCKCILPLCGDAPPSHLGHFPCPAQMSPRYLRGLSGHPAEVRETVTLVHLLPAQMYKQKLPDLTMKPEELHRFGNLSSAGSFCPLPFGLQWPYFEAVGQLKWGEGLGQQTSPRPWCSLGRQWPVQSHPHGSELFTPSEKVLCNLQDFICTRQTDDVYLGFPVLQCQLSKDVVVKESSLWGLLFITHQ